ncbi:MAG: hypothetical protein ACC662_00155 [Planctomycetota bacterium]
MSKITYALVILFLFALGAAAPVRAEGDGQDGVARPPAGEVDAWIDRALQARGPERDRLVRRLAASGTVAIRRLLERVEDVTPSHQVLHRPAPPKPGPDLLAIDMHFLEVKGPLLEAARAEGADLRAGRSALTLSAPAARALLARKGRGVRMLSAPRLTTFDGQKADISVLGQTSYVKDYDVRTDAKGRTMVDPVIGMVQDGLVVEATASILDGNRIALDARVSYAELRRPIDEMETTIAGQTVTIQLPEVTVAKAHATIDLDPGDWACLEGFGQGKVGVRVLLIHVQKVRRADASLKPR